MSDDATVLDAVDRRGRAAARALDRALAEAAGGDPVPAADAAGAAGEGEREAGRGSGSQDRVTVISLPVERGRRPGRRALALAAAAAAVVAAVGVGVAVGGRDDPSTVAGATDGYLVAGWLPPGMAASSATVFDGLSSGAPGGAEPVGGEVVAYGDGAADDPWAGPTISVALLAGAPEEDHTGERVSVDGHDAWVDEARGVTVTWDAADGRVVVRGSDDLDRATVLAAAEGAGPSPAVAAAARPPGFVEIARGPLDAMMGAGGPGYLGGAAGVAVGYAAGNRSDPSAAVGVFQRRGPASAVDLVRLTSARTWAGEVRGQHAVVGDAASEGGPPEPFVQWREPSGLVTTVSGSGVDETTLLRVAEGLRPAEPGEIDRLVDATPAGGAGDGSGQTESETGAASTGDGEVFDGEVVVSGEHAGEPWRLLLGEPQPDGYRYVGLVYRTSAGSVGWPSERTPGALLVGSSAGGDWDVPVAYGVAADDLEVTAEAGDGRAVVVDQAVIDGEGLRGFVVFLPGENGDVDIVATDPSGRQVAREAVPLAPSPDLSGGG